jgi:hypothetical protein
MKKAKFCILLFFILKSSFAFCQDYKEYLSPYWDDYYNSHPSAIEKNYQASDFINVIDYVSFSPKASYLNGSVTLLKKCLLKLEYADLRQMMITGSFYSRSKKHDDYFQLYNLTYTTISKGTWDSYCPYLIPMMELDGIIKLH